MKIFQFLFLLLVLSSCSYGENSDTKSSLIQLSIIGFFILVVFFGKTIQHYKRSKNKKKFFTWKRFRLPISILGLITISFTIVANFTTDAKFKKNWSEIQNGTSISKSLEQFEVYIKANREEHFGFIIEEIEASLNYTDDFKHIAKALIVVGKHNENIFDEIKNVKDKEHPYYNYLEGIVHLENKKIAKAKISFEKELKKGGAIKSAFENLNKISTDDEFYKLLVYDKDLNHQSIARVSRVAITNNDIWLYSYSIIRYVIRNVTIGVFLGATFILLTWLFFFKGLDIFQPNKWLPLVVTLALSCFTTLLTLPVSDLITYFIPQFSDNAVWNTFLHYFIQVGMTEELMKIIPVLLILLFTKQIKEPIDFILFTSVAALGFAYVENFIYFGRHSLEIMSSRGMQFGNAHLIFSGIIGYGLVLQRFKYKNWNFAATLFISFLLASLVHGLWDFILVIELPRILFYLFALVLMHIWGTFINNCLNNSQYYNAKQVQKLVNLRFYLILSLVAIVLFEFVLTGFTQGRNIAHMMLQFSILPSVYFIYFTSIAIGKFDIIKGYWQKIRPPKKLLEIVFPMKGNKGVFIGKEVTVVANKSNQEFKKFTPVHGIITDRKIVRRNDEWFLIKLDWALPISTHYNNMFLIRLKIADSDLDLDQHVPVEIGLIKRDEMINRLQFNLKPRSMHLAFVTLKEE